MKLLKDLLLENKDMWDLSDVVASLRNAVPSIDSDSIAFKSIYRDVVKNSDVIIVPSNFGTAEELENIDISRLKNIKTSIDNLFIEVHFTDKSYSGFHLSLNKNYGIEDNYRQLSLHTFKNNDIRSGGAFFDVNKLPRFYVTCSKKCNNRNITEAFGTFGNRVCKKSPFTANCELSRMIIRAFQFITLVLEHIENNKVEYVETINTPVIRKSSSIKITTNAQRIIQITGIRKVYNNNAPKGHHSSPIPHSRRGHYRHLKSGKVIWIKNASVKGGQNNPKIYKIKSTG